MKKVFGGGTQGATNNTCGKHATDMYMYTIQHASSVCKYGLMQCVLQKQAAFIESLFQFVSATEYCTIGVHCKPIFNQDTLHYYTCTKLLYSCVHITVTTPPGTSVCSPQQLESSQNLTCHISKLTTSVL